MTRLPYAAADAAGEAGPAPNPSDWFVGLGSGFVLLGGLVAAVSDPLELHDGSWLAAYLVLVCGAAQFAMGRAPSWFGQRCSTSDAWARVVGWNVGNAAVVAGTLITAPYLVDVGGGVLLVVLVNTIRAALQPPAEEAASGDPHVEPAPVARMLPPAARTTYVVLLIFVAASIPVGLALAHLRAG